MAEVNANESITTPPGLTVCQVLEEARPSRELESTLDDAVNDGHYDLDMRVDVPPVYAGNMVDGEKWGWVWGTERWWLLPMRFHDDATELARAHASFTESMTGVIIESRALFTDIAAVYWLFDDIDGDIALDVTYCADPCVMAERVFESILENPSDRPCAACEYDGWSVSLLADERLAPNALQFGLSLLFPLCDTHRVRGVVECGGDAYLWNGDRWEAVDDRVS